MKISQLHRMIAQCPVFLPKKSFVNTSKKLSKNRNQALPVERYFTLKLQPWTKYLRKTLIYMQNSALQKKFISTFQQFSFSRNTGHQVITLLCCKIFLIFSNFLRTQVVSHSAARQATRIYHVFLLIITLCFTCGEKKNW